MHANTSRSPDGVSVKRVSAATVVLEWRDINAHSNRDSGPLGLANRLCSGRGARRAIVRGRGRAQEPLRRLSRARRGRQWTLRGAHEGQAAFAHPIIRRKPGRLPLSECLPGHRRDPPDKRPRHQGQADRYAAEIIRQYDELGTEHPQTVRCRILELVFYLATIQKP